MPDRLALYHRLPYPLRVAAATARGLRLRRWRYGPETEELVARALERDAWGPERWKSWQEERLSELLHRAATRVPFYREQWSRRRAQGDRSSWEELSNWPVLKKEDLRAASQALVADDRDVRHMFRERTSGTSGTPVNLFLPRASLREWFALFEARVRRWHGVSIGDRWAIMGGQLVVPFEQTRPPYWVLNAAARQLYLSTHHISTRTAGAYVAALRRHRPTHVVAYPSSAAVLAESVSAASLGSLRIQIVFTNSETLTDVQRERISNAFGCPVADTYGMAEMVVGSSECQHRTMHTWPDAGIIEIFGDSTDGPVGSQQEGRIVATGLLNPDMPLIRYETGDRLQAASDSTGCACRRSLPRLGELQGRSSDMIVTPDGRSIFWLNPIFYDVPVGEAQIVQHEIDRIEVRIVPGNGFDEAAEREIVKRLHQRVGDMDVRTAIVEAIPRDESGKFRPVISKVTVPRRPAGVDAITREDAGT